MKAFSHGWIDGSLNPQIRKQILEMGKYTLNPFHTYWEQQLAKKNSSLPEYVETLNFSKHQSNPKQRINLAANCMTWIFTLFLGISIYTAPKLQSLLNWKSSQFFHFKHGYAEQVKMWELWYLLNYFRFHGWLQTFLQRKNIWIVSHFFPTLLKVHVVKLRYETHF